MKNLNKVHIRDNIKKEQMLKVLEEEVFSDMDFIRHIKETAIRENIEYEVAETVIKDYLTKCAYEMVKVSKERRRIVLFGFLNIDIVEPRWNEFSRFFKRKQKKNESQ